MLFGAVPVQRTTQTAASVELDAVIAAAGDPDDNTVVLLQEAFRHGKAIGATGAGAGALAAAGLPDAGVGIVTGDAATVTQGVLDLLPEHRVWARLEPTSPAQP